MLLFWWCLDSSCTLGSLGVGGQRGGFPCTLPHSRSSGRVTVLSPPVTGGHIPTVLLPEGTGSRGLAGYFRGLINWKMWHLLCP